MTPDSKSDIVVSSNYMCISESGNIRTFLREYYRMQRQQSCGCNIPATQCHILCALGESGGTFALSELVSYLGLEKSWVSRAVEKLAVEGCLEKTRCGSDARCYTLVLTGTGWDRYEKLNGILDDQAAGIMNAIPDNKKAQVRESIALLAAALKKTGPVCTAGKKQVCTGIREAEPEEYDVIKALLRSRKLPAADLDKNGLQHFIVAAAGEQIIGCAGFERHGNYALLRSVAVTEAAAGHGTGTALVDLIEQKISGAGISTVFLLTTDAAAFWKRFGYTETERSSAPEEIRESPEFKTACPESAILMSRQLSAEKKGEGVFL